MRLPFIQGSSVLVIATLFWSTIATGVFQAARWLVPLLVGACFIERGCSPYTEGTVAHRSCRRHPVRRGGAASRPNGTAVASNRTPQDVRAASQENRRTQQCYHARTLEQIGAA